MGIKDLNKITVGMSKYKGKFKTIIIDALNMYHIYVSAITSKLTKDNGYSYKSILTQMSFIISECSQRIYICFLSLLKYLEKDGIIYVVLDPPKTPDYEMLGGEHYDLKKEEQAKRKVAQSKIDKSGPIKDILDLKYGLTTKISEIKEWQKLLQEIGKGISSTDATIEEIFNQQYFFSQIGNQLILLDIVINEAIKKIKTKNVNVECIFSESEADFVIKYIAYMCNSQPVLVCSKDTDYFVLLAELKNVYKTTITNIKDSGIFYPYELWRTLFSDQITIEQIYALATIAGNDYTIHESLLNFDVKKYKALMNIDNSFSDLKRCKKIKKYINFIPTGITSEEQLLSIIKEPQFIKSLEVYRSWHLNCKIMHKQLNYDDSIKHIVVLLQRKFKTIYEFDVYENCLYNVRNIDLTVETLKEILESKNIDFTDSDSNDDILISESDNNNDILISESDNNNDDILISESNN